MVGEVAGVSEHTFEQERVGHDRKVDEDVLYAEDFPGTQDFLLIDQRA